MARAATVTAMLALVGCALVATMRWTYESSEPRRGPSAYASATASPEAEDGISHVSHRSPVSRPEPGLALEESSSSGRVEELAALLAGPFRPHEWELCVSSLSAGLDDDAVGALLGRCNEGNRDAALSVAAVELLRGVASHGSVVTPVPDCLHSLRHITYSGEQLALRAAAARALAFFGTAVDRLGLVDRLVLEVDDSERNALTWALCASHEDDVVDALLEHLEGPREGDVLRILAALDAAVWTPRSRAYAATAIAHGFGKGKRAENVRRVSALAAIGGPHVHDVLTEALLAEQDHIARAAAAALAAGGEPDSLRALAALRDNTSLPTGRRLVAIEALVRAQDLLGASERTRLADDLIDLLRRHPDAGMRRRAVWALAPLGGPRGRAALAETVRDDENDSVRRAAAVVLDRRQA